MTAQVHNLVDNQSDTREIKIIKKNVRAGGKHQMAACTNCKRKRKKCDGNYPRCRGCVNAGVDCTIYDHTIGRVIPRNYIQSLEEKVSELQTQLNVTSRSNSSTSINYNSQEFIQTQSRSQFKDRSYDTPDGELNNRKEGEDDQNLEMEIGYITLGTAAESRYIGNSSAFSIAKAITQSINYYKHASALVSNITRASSTRCNTPEFPVFYPPFSKPSISVARYFWKTYKDMVQCQYPFLDLEWTEKAFTNVMINDSQKPDELFFIYMIFAIGSQLSAAANSAGIPYTKVYYDKAMENIAPLVEVTTLQTVQVYLLLSMFSQKMPEASSIWQLSGLAIRSIGILGLHRDPFKRVKDSPDPEVQKALDLRARVFWSAYGIERINGIILGRPFGIADIDIDVSLPQETPDTRVAIHVIKMRRIQLNICAFVYKPKKLIESLEEVDSMRLEIILELNEWVKTFPMKEKPVSTFETNNWCEISYHNSVLLLLRPVVLEVSKLQKRSSLRLLKWFKVFAQSSSAICINYKDLLLKNQLSYSWMTIHCSFVTGLSFLYCLWIDSFVGILEWKRRSLIYDTISACSQVLFVFAEKFSTARMFRDTFERLANIMLAKCDDDVFPQSETVSHRSPLTIGNSSRSEYSNSFHEVGFFNGVLNEESIGIEEYQRFESSRKLTSELTASSYALNNELSWNFNLNSTHNESADKFWEFLGGTGDKYLRDIICDIEHQFGL